MNKSSLVTLAIAFCFFGNASVAGAANPPNIPGKMYLKTADGCGFLIFAKGYESGLTKAYWDERSRKYWVGACRHGLVDGPGSWLDKSGTPVAKMTNFEEETYVLGENASVLLSEHDRPDYSVKFPNESSFGFEAESGMIEYKVTHVNKNLKAGDKFYYTVQSARFPVVWNSGKRSKPAFNLNDGSAGDDIVFKYSGPLPESESYYEQVVGMNFQAMAMSCNEVNLNIKGCKPPEKVFDVYGISIGGIKIDGLKAYEPQFIPCPDPKTSSGCDALWEKSVGKYIDAMLAHAKMVSEKIVEQNAWLETKRQTAEAALPSSWKSYWASNAVNRESVNLALQCREISDYGPISLEDAEYIQKKYSNPPCNSAVVAGVVLSRIENYVTQEQKSAERRMRKIADLEQYKRDRALSRSQAWSGFFNALAGVLDTHMQIQQQRIDNTNAQITAADQQSAAAPVYQSYGQPAASSPQSYDPSKVQIRAIHKPELDAGSCVKLVQLANGDPLSSFGSQVFSNQCGQTVEVFWCKVGDECERGAGGSWTVASGSSYPVSSGQYRYGACLGKNSGALVRDASGVHTGRYACTGP